jgi:Flp pilus assembly secretin CpaC
VEELNEQAQRINTNSRAVKEALKTKLAESHKELSDLDKKIHSRQQDLDVLVSRLEDVMRDDEANGKLADEQAAENLLELHALQAKMDDIRKEMLIDEEAIVEQRQEHEQLLKQMEKVTADWKFEHEKRIEREKKEISLLREESQQQIDLQVERAKVEFQALGDSLAAQKSLANQNVVEQSHT